MTGVGKSIPDHVKATQIVDFDIYTDPRMLADVHLGLKALHASAPDIFFTPRNGGHWVITRFDMMSRILRDWEHFSNRELDIPKSNSPNLMIPLNLDPPDHAPYRMALLRHFDKVSIAAREESLRTWANRLIDQVIERGECDFTETLGAGFPVSVFMELMGLPLDRFEEFRSIVLEYFSRTTIERRIQLQNTIIGAMTQLIEERRRQRCDDLISKLLDADVKGRNPTLEELQSICFLLFLGGLDTVANALTFAFRHLAGDKALQARLRADPQLVPEFVEESLRRYAIVNQTRIVKKDITIEEANFRAGDMVLCPLTLAGLDERKNPDPERFDVDRKAREHITFSTGAHICIGNVLARAEMRVFTTEWLRRVPEFSVAQSEELEWRAGLVMALMNLPLRWPAQGRSIV